MFGIVNYEAFVIAGILLNLTPGVDTIYILSKSITGGRNYGLASALGISTGCLAHTILAALGLSVILLASPELFFIVKVCGAIYLIGMGIMAIIKRDAFAFSNNNNSSTTLRKAYAQGIITNILNPKVALFFLAFLPQFIDPINSFGPLPFLLLGLTFVLTGTLWCLVIAFASAYFNTLLQRNRQVSLVVNIVAAVVYILLGISIFATRL